MEDKITIPPLITDHIKMHILFPSSLFWVLNETYGEDQWEFVDTPTREEVESAPACFAKGMDDGEKEDGRGLP